MKDDLDEYKLRKLDKYIPLGYLYGTDQEILVLSAGVNEYRKK